MDSVAMPGTGRRVPRLGFGGASLVGGPSRRGSLALLETAFEAGIRHFDVAPSYGLGSAEEVLGEFVIRHRNEITVTTKFGSPRVSTSKRAVLQFGRAITRSLVNRIPAVKKRLLAELSRQTPKGPAFDAEQMAMSLAASLKALRTDRIDLFLLHEVEAPALNDEFMLALDRAVEMGKVGAWGIGSARAKIDQLSAAQMSRASVLQFDWSPLAPERLAFTEAFVVTHQALAHALTRMAAPEAAAERRAWSAVANIDLNDPAETARMILAVAMAANPTGLVLFWSGKADRIRSNVAALHPPYTQAAVRLLEHLRERPPLSQ